MKKQNDGLHIHLLASLILIGLLLAGCSQSSEACPLLPYDDQFETTLFAGDNRLPFQFPLDDKPDGEAPIYTNFCASQVNSSVREYHAAEDFLRPAGTPVYAMADGKVSFSGPMDGYGWLIIVDHPQANLYTLYGHLSPSRWRIKSGTVEQGELIAYLGDSHENGGSSEHPLQPHLHFGVRAGQRSDYPGMGDWRWQAGWIKPCPQDLGWLQPSAILSSHEMPIGGFPEPTANYVAIWGFELLFTGIYLIGGVGMLVFAIKKDLPFLLVPYGVLLFAAGWIYYGKGTRMSYALFAMAVLLSVFGIYKLIRRYAKTQNVNT